MVCIDIIEEVHTSTKRNYLERVIEFDKAECTMISKQFGENYRDGDRKNGYGDYYYYDRWGPIVERMTKHYDLKSRDNILDEGCGKGFLLYEFTQVIPGIEVTGINISQYGIDKAKK